MISPVQSLIGKLFFLCRQSIASIASSFQGGPSSGLMTVIDHRTGKDYTIPIAHNAVQAIHFQQICAEDSPTTPRKNEVKNGLRVLDPGFHNTAVMESEVTYVDGVNGTIHFRGRSIDDLFGKYGFEEVSHLLIWGHLPTKLEKTKFRAGLIQALAPPKVVVDAIRVLPPTTPVFALVIAGLAAYAANDPSSIPSAADRPMMYKGDKTFIDNSIIHTMASMTAIVAVVYCHQHGRELTPPDPNLSFIANILLMMGFVDESTKTPSPKVVETLERVWILYCDHEMTNSTAAFLHVASTLADPISCCMAYVAACNGPLHGGAIDLAYKSFERLQSPNAVPELIADIKAKKYRLFGYGHRIYKTVDPRAKFIRGMLEELEEEMRGNPLLKVALEIDDVASKDEYFTKRNLKANADLFGCFVYMALGFEPEIIAALMMTSRVPGVMAHWRESLNQVPRLWRPQQVYIGAKTRSLAPVRRTKA